MTTRSETSETWQSGDEAGRGRAEVMLRAVAERTAWATGAAFFREVARGLSEAFEAPCTCVSTLVDRNRVGKPLAFWHEDHYAAADNFLVADAPCATVLDGTVAAIPDHVAARFPAHRSELEALGAESYLAAPVIDAGGVVIGVIAVIDRRPRRWSDAELAAVQIMGARGARTAVEIERARDQREHEAAQAARGRLTDLGHDLRTPLNGILGYAQLLARDPTLGARQIEAVNHVRVCGERLLGLVEEILDPARSADGRHEDQPAMGAEQPRTQLDPATPGGELPPALRAGLLEQSLRGDIAEINRSLDELERLARHPRLLAELRAHARAFDMKAIRERVHGVTPEQP